MHVHHLPMQPGQIQQQPAPKTAVTERLRAVFEQTMALAVNERSPTDRRRFQRETPQPGKTGQNRTAAVSAPAAQRAVGPAHDGAVDVLA